MGMDLEGKNGNQFRATIWTWGAICHVMKESGYEVPEAWHYNDGAGPSSQEECDDLAELIDLFLISRVDAQFFMESDWVRVSLESGVLISPGTPDSISPYSVRRDLLEEFVTFLRTSGGFAIY